MQPETKHCPTQWGQAQLRETLDGFHLAHGNGKVWRCHLLVHHSLQAAGTAGGMEYEAVSRIVIKGTKKGNALNVVPVEMRHGYVRRDGTAFELTTKLMAYRRKPVPQSKM